METLPVEPAATVSWATQTSPLGPLSGSIQNTAPSGTDSAVVAVQEEKSMPMDDIAAVFEASVMPTVSHESNSLVAKAATPDVHTAGSTPPTSTPPSFVATWYAADLQWKEHYPKVMAALKDIYNVSEGALEFFRVLLEDVDSHITWEEEGLAYWACTTERQLTAARAFRERLDIEDQLLVAVETARTAERLPFQTPAI